MTKRKKPEPKPSPPDIATDKTAALVRGAGESQAVPTIEGKIAVVEALQSLGFLENACLICGTLRTADVCPVDGYRFTQEQA